MSHLWLKTDLFYHSLPRIVPPPLQHSCMLDSIVTMPHIPMASCLELSSSRQRVLSGRPNLSIVFQAEQPDRYYTIQIDTILLIQIDTILLILCCLPHTKIIHCVRTGIRVCFVHY